MRLKIWLSFLGAVMLAALIIIVSTDLRREWNQRMANAERHLQGLALTLEEHAIRTFNGPDILVVNQVIASEASLAESGTPGDLLEILAENAHRIPHMRGLLLVDESGVIRMDSHESGILGRDLSRCDCLTALREGRADGRQIDLVNADMTDLLIISRALRRADGGFSGAVMALVDASYFTDFYEAVRVGDGGLISLLTADGKLLVQAPPGSMTPGVTMAGTPMFERIVASNAPGMLDHDDLVAWRDMRDYPLILAVTAERADVLAGWESRRFWSIASLLGISMAVLLVVSYLWTQINRMQDIQNELTLQKSYFQQLFDSSPEGVVILDNHDRIVGANRAFQEMFQYSRDEVTGRMLNELILPDGMVDEGTTLSQRVLKRERINTETMRRRKDGSLVHVSILGSPIMMLDNQVGVYGIYRDISRRTEAERQIRESEERHRVVAEQTGNLIYDYNVLTGEITWSGAIKKITGYEYDEFQEVDIATWEGMLHPDDRDEAMRLLEEARVRAGHYSTEYRLRRKNGTWVFLEDNGVFMRNDDGVVHRMLGSMNDITERKRITSEMAYQATHDSLTGLVNRNEFEERVSQLLYSRRGGYRSHALLFIDLDQFKVVNDTCGHQAGDHLLRQLTGLMASTMRESDTLARLGGDEFGVLLVNCPLEKAMDIASGIVATINEFRFVWDGKTFSIGASLGLVEITRETESVASLFSAADSACYAAKDKGRNRVVVYRKGDREMVQRHGEMAWVSRITEALEEDRFELHWQRIERVSAADDGRRHGEFLLRMIEIDGELALPGGFIPAAERYNLMPALDRWVIRRSLTKIAEHGRSGHAPLLASINVSGLSLGSENFIEYVVDELASSDADPATVCFEITETAAIANLQRAQEFIGRMHAMGCSIALDDFGSGLSSFAYLKTLPVDYLKIDGTFVRDILRDQANQAMVEAIIRIGQVMGIRTIAEFAESEDIVDQLREMGVDYAQGYALHRPEPWDTMPAHGRG